MKQRFLNVLIAFDQLIHVLVTLGYGMPDETLSGAAWRSEQSGNGAGAFFRPVIDTVFFFEVNHCRKSAEAERRRAAFQFDRRTP